METPGTAPLNTPLVTIIPKKFENMFFTINSIVNFGDENKTLILKEDYQYPGKGVKSRQKTKNHKKTKKTDQKINFGTSFDTYRLIEHTLKS